LKFAGELCLKIKKECPEGNKKESKQLESSIIWQNLNKQCRKKGQYGLPASLTSIDKYTFQHPFFISPGMYNDLERDKTYG
jgi:hypothetical protein